MGSYTGIQVAGYVAPLVALPVIARSTSSAGWASLGLGQAIGTMASVVILFGWWTVGPAEYAKEAAEVGRRSLYRRSLVERLLVSVVVLPVAVTAAALVSAGGHELLAAIAVVGMANYGWSPTWYFIARSEPRKLALYEAAPRVVASLASAVLVGLTGEVMIYPVLLAVLPVVSYLVALPRETPSGGARSVTLVALAADLRRQTPVAASNIVGGLYSQLLVPYVATLASPAQSATFVSGDRLYKAGRFTITAASNTLQPWTLEKPTVRRQVVAIGGHAVLGLAGGVAAWLLMPLVSRLMFGPDLAVSSSLALGFGVGFLCTSVATPMIRNVLVPTGRRWVPFVGTCLGTVVGFGSLALLYDSMGIAAAAVAVGASEGACLLVVSSVTVPILLRARRSPEPLALA